MEKKNKFFSRKFLMCLGAALGSIGTTIAGLCIESKALAIVGAICTAASAGIYTFCEAWVDGKAVKVNTVVINNECAENVEK